MTLPPDRIGDKGQRFELHVVGWPKAGDNVISWSDDKWGLFDTGHSILTSNPRVEAAYVIDRRVEETIDIEP